MVGWVIALAFLSAALGAIISTPFGRISGNELPCSYEYLSIPYALPPVGQLRFEAPQPIEPWSDVIDGTHVPPSCMSSFPSQSPQNESCLYLNVWYPKRTSSEPLPVMVYIHGGAWVLGSSAEQLYNGSALACSQQLVVVNMNYRLGYLGWSAFGLENDSPLGILDQQVALQWVQKAIPSFGGDPKRVTLVGHSAGGASIGLHYYIPSSWPLFSQGMINSGVPQRIKTHKEVVQPTQIFAASLGCTGNPQDIKQCMRSFPARKLTDGADQSCVPTIHCWLPFISKSGVLTEQPYLITDCSKISTAPIVVGYDRNDSSLIIAQELFNPPLVLPPVITKEYVLQELSSWFLFNSTEIQMLLSEYSSDFNSGNFTALSALVTDALLQVPTLALSRKMTQCGVRVNYWIWDYKVSFAPLFLQQANFGVGHGEELTFMFGNACWLTCTYDPFKGVFTNQDKSFVEAMQSDWGAFIKGGIPWSVFPHIKAYSVGGSLVVSEQIVSQQSHEKFWHQLPWFFF